MYSGNTPALNNSFALFLSLPFNLDKFAILESPIFVFNNFSAFFLSRFDNFEISIAS